MANLVKTPIWQYKCMVEWVKTVLLAELRGDAGICIVGIDDGVDIGKCLRANVPRVVFIDAKKALEVAEKRFLERQEPFAAEFVVGTPDTGATWRNLGRAPCSLVLVPEALDFCCESIARADAFLAAAASNMVVGGHLAGICIDSARAWAMAQKAALGGGAMLNLITEDLFELAFERGLDEFPLFGTRVVLTMNEGDSARHHAEEQRRSLVHFESLIQMARKHNLYPIEITNLIEFFDDNKRPHASLLKRSGVLPPGKPHLEQTSLIGLFCVYIFIKRD